MILGRCFFGKILLLTIILICNRIKVGDTMTNEKEIELINLFEEKMCINCCNKNCNRSFRTQTLYAPKGSKNYSDTYCIKCNSYTINNKEV